MTDPFTIAVSVAGLASFGLQLADGLNKYASSTIDSKGRVKAILYDTKLTTSVLQQFEAILKEDTAVSLSDAAKGIASDAISGCQKVFEDIHLLILGTKTPVSTALGGKDFETSFSKRLKWPFVEPKLELLRSNLEKIKTTLQLLISLVTYGIVKRLHPGTKQVIDQQEHEIRILMRQKLYAEEKVEQLRQQCEGLRIDSTSNLPTDVVPNPPANEHPGFSPAPRAVQERSGSHLKEVTHKSASVQAECTPFTGISLSANTPEAGNAPAVEGSSNSGPFPHVAMPTLDQSTDSKPLLKDLQHRYTYCLKDVHALDELFQGTLEQLFGRAARHPRQCACERSVKSNMTLSEGLKLVTSVREDCSDLTESIQRHAENFAFEYALGRHIQDHDLASVRATIHPREPLQPQARFHPPPTTPSDESPESPGSTDQLLDFGPEPFSEGPRFLREDPSAVTAAPRPGPESLSSFPDMRFSVPPAVPEDEDPDSAPGDEEQFPSVDELLRDLTDFYDAGSSEEGMERKRKRMDTAS